MVQLQNLNLRLLLGMQGLGEELTAKRCDVIVEQLQKVDAFRVLEVLAYSSSALILTEGLPEANRRAQVVL